MVQNFMDMCPGVPILNIWSKIDLDSELQFHNVPENNSIISQGNRKTYIISSKNNDHCEEPFLYILKILTQNPQLTFL